jgi:hypothetical protein
MFILFFVSINIDRIFHFPIVSGASGPVSPFKEIKPSSKCLHIVNMLGREMKMRGFQKLEYFCEWLDRVEAIVEEEIGYELRDLPDQPYRDLFDDKYSPEIVAESVIEEWRAEMLIDF